MTRRTVFANVRRKTSVSKLKARKPEAICAANLYGFRWLYVFVEETAHDCKTKSMLLNEDDDE